MTPTTDVDTAARPGLPARAFVALQSLLPQHLLSRLMHGLARVTWRPVKALLIGGLVRLYRIDLAAAAEPDPSAYPHFNAFFTRALRPEARPLDPDPAAILSPVDARVSALGRLEQGQFIQAKGQQYPVGELLADPTASARFAGGTFVTLYLSPRDYHRIHLPLAGELQAMTHVPGRLFSVNAMTSALLPRLHARNERVIARFAVAETEMTLVFVGAIFVGSIETVWSGVVTPPTRPGPRHWRWPDAAGSAGPRFARGAEIARFNLGSTVILLFPPGVASWRSDLAPGTAVRMGERLGTFAPVPPLAVPTGLP